MPSPGGRLGPEMLMRFFSAVRMTGLSKMASPVGHGTTLTGTLARSVSPFTMASTSTIPDVVTRFVHCAEPDVHASHALPGLANRRDVDGTVSPPNVAPWTLAALAADRAFAVRAPIDADDVSNRSAAPPSGVNDQPSTVSDPFAVA